MAILGLTTGDYNDILGGPLFQGFRVPLPAYGSLESYIRSRVPGVNLPVPTAASMVKRVSASPLGRDLARLEDDLARLPETPGQLLPAERRTLVVVLAAMRSRVDRLLAEARPY